ncbi:MAG TPA: Type 1 glutamine amidotransferase-like domain-containing protein [Gemmatimonadaceae bacterium]
MRLAPLLAIIALPCALVAQATQQSQSKPAPAPEGFGDAFKARPYGKGSIKVGNEKGTVIVVGGGGMGPEVYKAFIDAAGGPDAIILDVPNASEQDTGQMNTANTGASWRNNGAKNVVVLYTRDRKVADSDTFTAIIKKAGGVWFEGGRQYHLVQDYGGTKTEKEIMALVDRGGVVGGSSAGASILGDFMVRGAPSNNNFIMDYPGYERGFGYLKNVGIDQHVVARSRLPDLADSIVPRYKDLLGISEDEGTVWVVKGDTATIIGRNKAFAYNAKDKNDDGYPFITLHPGDKFNLNTRKVISRAIDRSPVKEDFIKSMFSKYNDANAGGATVLVAQNGEVFIDHAFGVAQQPKYMPKTTLPQFDVGDISKTFTELCAQLPPPQRGRGNATPDSNAAPAAGRGRGRGGPPPSPLQQCVTRVSTTIGAHQTAATDSTHIQSSVDELYRFALGLDQAAFRGTPNAPVTVDLTKGWAVDTYKGATRVAAYVTPDGKKGAFVRLPDKHVAVIILTNDANADAKGMAEKILDQILANQK